MSRKHYTEAAEVIKRQVDVALTEMSSNAEQSGAMYAAENIAKELAGMFKRDNSRFDRDKFLAACGL
jgi:ribosomal protein S7